MPDISSITLPSGSTYNMKDAAARADIADLQQLLTSGVNYRGTTTTALTDGATTATVTINGSSHTAANGDIVAYGNKEFIFDGTNWKEFGDLGAFKALAYKDNASATYTPAGSNSQPTFTGTEATISVKGTPSGSVSLSIGSGTANYTPEGSVTKPNVSVTPQSATVNSITAVGTLPSLSCTVSNENLTLSFDAGSLPTKGSDTTVLTGVSAELDAAPVFSGTGVDLEASFSGNELTSSGIHTPAGSVSAPTFTGTEATITVS